MFVEGARPLCVFLFPSAEFREVVAGGGAAGYFSQIASVTPGGLLPFVTNVLVMFFPGISFL